MTLRDSILIIALFFVATLFGCGRGQSGGAASSSGLPQQTVSGTVEVLLAENQAMPWVQKIFRLHEADGSRVFDLDGSDSRIMALKNGTRVTINGQEEGAQMKAAEVKIEALPGGLSLGGDPLVSTLDTVRRRAVVLIVDLTDARASARYSRDQIASLMFTHPTLSVDAVVRAASYGQVAFPADTNGDGRPDVFGPFRVPLAKADCHYDAWADAADQAATAAGVNLSLYQHHVYVVPPYFDTGCGWTGLGHLGCTDGFCRTWIGLGDSALIYNHELGHNLGMMHASLDPENDGRNNDEYGDNSDPMGGNAFRVTGFNGAHLDQMGWLSMFPGKVLRVQSSGVFDLAPLGTDPQSTDLPFVLKIRKPSAYEYYYVSYRQATGLDALLAPIYTRGASIHRFSGVDGNTFYLATLGDGEQFADLNNNISVTQTGRATSGGPVTVYVGLGQINLPPPTPTPVPRSFAIQRWVTRSDTDGALYGFRLTGTSADLGAAKVVTYSAYEGSVLYWSSRVEDATTNFLARGRLPFGKTYIVRAEIELEPNLYSRAALILDLHPLAFAPETVTLQQSLLSSEASRGLFSFALAAPEQQLDLIRSVRYRLQSAGETGWEQVSEQAMNAFQVTGAVTLAKISTLTMTLQLRDGRAVDKTVQLNP